MEHHSTNHSDHRMVVGESSPVEYVKFIGIILAITGIAFLCNSGGWLEFMRWFMGMFFAVFASFKFVGYKMFALMFTGYDVVAKQFKPYAYIYPFLELALGIAYLANFAPAYRDVVTIMVMGIGTVGVAQEIRKRSGIHCACLGNIIKLPLSTVSLVEDVGMGLMGFVMLTIS